MSRRPAFVVTFVALMALVLPAGAAGDVTKKDKAGDTEAPRGLGAKDRKALDVVRFDAFPNRTSLVVTATMRGNAERIDRSALSRAAVALVLWPKQRGAAPRIVAATGDDKSVSNLPRSDVRGAVVDGRQVSFVVPGVGVGADAFRRVEVVTVAKAGTLAAIQRATRSQNVTDRLAVAITVGLLSDDTEFDDLDCVQLAERRSRLIAVALLFVALNQTSPSPLADLALRILGEEVDWVDEEIQERPCGLVLAIEASLRNVAGFPGEIRMDAIFRENRPPPRGFRAASTSPIDMVRMVVPDRQVTNFICGGQLPQGSITTTNQPNDTLQCTGGSLPLGESFSMNVQTSPPPSNGMGAQVFARQDGRLVGPLAVQGP